MKEINRLLINAKSLILNGLVIAVMFSSCSPQDEPMPDPTPQPPKPIPPVAQNDTVHITITSVADFADYLSVAQQQGRIAEASVANNISADSAQVVDNIIPWNLADVSGARKDSIFTKWNNKIIYPVTEGGQVLHYRNWTDAGRPGLGANPYTGLAYLAPTDADSSLFKKDNITLNVRRFPKPDEPTEQPGDGNYVIKSGADIENVVKGASEYNGDVVITIAGDIAMSNANIMDIEKLLDITSKHNVSVVGDIKIFPSESRVIIPRQVLAKIKDNNVKIVKANTSNAGIFHVSDKSSNALYTELDNVLINPAYITTNRDENFVYPNPYLDRMLPDTLDFMPGEYANASEFFEKFERRPDGKKRIIRPYDDALFSFNNWKTLTRIGQPSKPATRDYPNPDFMSLENLRIRQITTDVYSDSIGAGIKQHIKGSMDAWRGNPTILVAPAGTAVGHMEFYSDANYVININGKELTIVQVESMPVNHPICKPDGRREIAYPYQVDINKYLFVTGKNYAFYADPSNKAGAASNDAAVKASIQGDGIIKLNNLFLDRNDIPDMSMDGTWRSFFWKTYSEFVKLGKRAR